MKKVIYSLTLLLALAVTSVDASAQKAKSARNDQFGLLNHVAVGVDLISPDGFGINVGTCIFPWLQVRAGYSIVPWSITKWPFSIAGVGTQGDPIAADIKLNNEDVHFEAGAFMTRHTGNIMFDFFPSRKSSFHFTVGMLAGNDNLITIKNTKPLDDRFKGVGIAFYPGGDKTATNLHQVVVDKNGNLGLTIGRRWCVRPYVGLGWGSFVPSKRVGVIFDMGLEFNGGMGVIVDARDIHNLDLETGKPVRGMLDRAGLQTMLEDMTGKAADDSTLKALDAYQTLSTLPVSGYVKLALVVKLF
ncbi:MAG: hypothetical protein J6T35_06325 [Bacteroidales bacterium]|nr:hypothetical protein [Bacteroidales bacterium]